MVGAIVGGALSAAGGVASSLIGGSKASGGSQQSQYLQALEMNQNIANTAPFIGAGQYGVNALKSGLQSGQFGTPFDLSGQPTAADVPNYGQFLQQMGIAPLGNAPTFSWDPTQAGLAATPGYQFTRDQGLQAAQSSAAARGLGVSGASLKGAADYATGLADKTYNEQLQNAINIYTTKLAGYTGNINATNAATSAFGQNVNAFTAGQGAYQNQFSDYWANQTNPFNQLYDVARLGANSAASQGTSGTTAAQNIGNAAQNVGNAQGASIQGAGNALSNFFNSAGVQNALTGGGAKANNQSVTGGGLFNTFSGAPSYFSGSGNYYNPGAGYSPGAYDPTFAPGAAPATQNYPPIGFAQP